MGLVHSFCLNAQVQPCPCSHLHLVPISSPISLVGISGDGWTLSEGCGPPAFAADQCGGTGAATLGDANQSSACTF